MAVQVLSRRYDALKSQQKSSDMIKIRKENKKFKLKKYHTDFKNKTLWNLYEYFF